MIILMIFMSAFDGSVLKPGTSSVGRETRTGKRNSCLYSNAGLKNRFWFVLRCFCSVFLFSGLIFTETLPAVERVVILNTAASPIIHLLNLDSIIVGVTYNDETYSDKTQVGSHLSPNIEMIKALQPDLIIAGSIRAFPDKLAEKLGTQIFRYDPRNLEEILDSVISLGILLQREMEAHQIVEQERTKLDSISILTNPIPVVFEISQRPLKLAGKENIVNDIVEKAGGVNLITIEQKHVLISPEKVLMLAPRFYLFQTGPMNKNPVSPKKRNYFKTLNSCCIEVDQLLYTRAGLNAFDAVVELNRLFVHPQLSDCR